MNAKLMNECDDPESTRDSRTEFGSESDVNESIRASGLERADVLRVTVFARGSSAQSLGHA